MFVRWYLNNVKGCENDQRGKFVNGCLVSGGHTEGSRIIKEGYELCLDKWADKHKKCVDAVIKRFVDRR